jgi:hypothetical protein
VVTNRGSQLRHYAGMAHDDDGIWRFRGKENFYTLEPEPSVDDVRALGEYVTRTYGYRLLLPVDPWYTLSEVQQTLRADGPGAYLDLHMIQEDIAPKAPPATVEQQLIERFEHLGPADELVVTDPYLLFKSRNLDINEYAARVARLVAPTLRPDATLVLVVGSGKRDQSVEAGVLAALRVAVPALAVAVHESDEFHDRFWIADRQRGAIVGASINGIGRKIFFVDRLRESDVRSVVAELEELDI